MILREDACRGVICARRGALHIVLCDDMARGGSDRVIESLYEVDKGVVLFPDSY